MSTTARVRVLDAASIERSLTRIAHEILERNRTAAALGLVGVQTRGVPLARRLAAKLAAIDGSAPPVGRLDINLYRDDLSRIAEHPVLRETEIPFVLDDRAVVLVDDVLFTGRTVRAALDELADFGRPARIGLAVLVDRGGRELPIAADVVGEKVELETKHRVDVLVNELDGRDAVEIAFAPRPA